MKLNRKLILILALVLSVAMATTGTLAYLTDRDSEANVFTIGNVEILLNEKFEQNATLIPGVEIEKTPTITNTGKNDAWVWLTFSVPAELDNLASGTDVGSDNNNIHWNPKGATTEGYVTEERVSTAKESGFFTGHLEQTEIDKLTAQYINDNKMHWNVFNSLGEGENVYQENIEGILYNTYVLLYNKALTSGETTLPNIEKVYLDARIDIDPNGDLYRVVNGEVSKIDWNINTNGNPVIHVSAYGIQKDTFTTVNEAYAAYTAQWGTKGIEHADPNVKKVASFEELETALVNGESVKLTADVEWSKQVRLEANQNVTLDMNGKTIKDTGNTGTLYVGKGSSLTITGNGKIEKTDHYKNMLYTDGTLTIENGNFEYADWMWGTKGAAHDCDQCSNTINAPLNAGCLIVARTGGDHEGKLTILGGTFDSGVQDPQNFIGSNDRNLIMFSLVNGAQVGENETDVEIRGGTFVSADPAYGDANEPYSSYLVGQTEEQRKAGEAPDTYKIDPVKLGDGRTAYVVTYNGN